MVYDLAMLKAFYTLYEGKIERIRTIYGAQNETYIED